jgi:hypothetical protein
MFSLTAFSESNVLAKEKEEIKKHFSGSPAQIKKAINQLEWTGISDPDLFVVIVTKLNDGYLSKSRVDVEVNAWLAKGLALSGDPQYKKLLSTISVSGAPQKLRKHVKRALKRIDKFSTWNPIIAQNNDYAKSQTELDYIRITNMLNSRRGDLMSVGARKVYYNFSDNVDLTNMISITLSEKYAMPSTPDEIDAYSWMCKVLAETGNKEHKALLDKIANDRRVSEKLERHAKKSAAYLQ